MPRTAEKGDDVAVADGSGVGLDVASASAGSATAWIVLCSPSLPTSSRLES